MTTFSVGVNQKFDTAADIEAKLVDLKSGVTEVNFGGNSYGVGACEAIAKQLAKVDTLEVANLDDMFTGRLRAEIPDSMDYLLTALLSCPHAHTVNLSDNAFGIATVTPLEKFLKQHVPLRHLIFTNNGFGPDAGARVGLALEELAAKKKAVGNAVPLESVICGRNRLENGSMEAWAQFLKAHGTVKDLRLYQNGIRREGVEHLMREGLKHSPGLETLDLQDNTFTEYGTLAMVDVLAVWPDIKELSINDCLLGAQGSVALMEALAQAESLRNLETLRLQYNEIDTKGLAHLKRAVATSMPKLKLLEINGNRFSEDHPDVESIMVVFNERGFGELDELDDMEDESDEDEDEDDEDDEDRQDELEAGARDAQYTEDVSVSEVKDKKVDDLADKLAKTTI